MKDETYFFISGIAITLLLVGVLWWTNERDKKLDAFADCITQTAKADGYDNPYSEKAWQIYAKDCVK